MSRFLHITFNREDEGAGVAAEVNLQTPCVENGQASHERIHTSRFMVQRADVQRAGVSSGGPVHRHPKMSALAPLVSFPTSWD